ncbi:MAG: hypothetical protein IPP37_15275 [Saprospiraceae bacterium]|nr:hypothetical protein [Saprospiraceae bacterium]
MGKRVDCLLIIRNIFVIEFKVGEKEFINQNLEQVWDYALDLKNFHKPSHSLCCSYFGRNSRKGWAIGNITSTIMTTL